MEAETGHSSENRATTRECRAKCGYSSPVASPFNDTSKSKAKPTRAILPANCTSRNGKEIICRKRFGVLAHFAFSGICNAGSAPCTPQKSPGSRDGVFIISSRVCWVVPPVQKTASCSIQSATIGFIACVCPYRNRVSLKEALEGPEPDDGKLSRPVLRWLAPSNGGRLLGEWFRELTQEEVYFVTRMKEKAVYAVQEEVRVPQNRRGERGGHRIPLEPVGLRRILQAHRLSGQRRRSGSARG